MEAIRDIRVSEPMIAITMMVSGRGTTRRPRAHNRVAFCDTRRLRRDIFFTEDQRSLAKGVNVSAIALSARRNTGLSTLGFPRSPGSFYSWPPLFTNHAPSWIISFRFDRAGREREREREGKRERERKRESSFVCICMCVCPRSAC